MLHIVAERFLKIAERHLNEATAWIEVSKRQTELFGIKYANRKANEHLEMVKYWQTAAKSLHYKPGTWAYKF